MIEEPIGVWGSENITFQGVLEHLNVTKDQSDYLWYMTRIYVRDSDISFWEENEISPTLSIDSMRDFMRVFINGRHAGSAKGDWVKVLQPLQLSQGFNDIVLLSETVGLQNYGAFLEKDGAGFRGQVKLTGFKNGDIDLTQSSWTYQIGLQGEFQKFYAVNGDASTKWVEVSKEVLPAGFSWYKAHFDAPDGTDPVVLDLSTMSKGQAWVNGHHMGRYWTLTAPKDGCQENCDYRGAYNENKCTTNCGKPTQTWYHIPRSWLQPSDNLLVIFEETDKTPFDISLKIRFTGTVCGQVSENHYPSLNLWGQLQSSTNTPAAVHLQCDPGHTISSIEFASYGTPQGSCQKFSKGSCHASNSELVVSEACQGRNSCSISVSNDAFGDPCNGVTKTLAVEVQCSAYIGSSASK
ncbi:galactosidase [Lithospermum erythrorhizon]|uniref:beta-galactosidase n=1 Tax=Lithospermum erythrorhizon TaxID=34254 RepID=A0AAV3RC59_LITER